MRFTRLTLTDFRSYQSLTWHPRARISVLVGPNGSGKTNLLEAVSLLTPGRGLRGARMADLVRRGAPGGWAVAGRFATAEGAIDIGTGTAPDSSGDRPADRRVFRLDGAAPRSQAEVAAHVAAVWLTPQMDRLFQEGLSGRRRFLDRLVWALEPGHAREIAAHDTAMAQRNRLLAEGRSWGGPGRSLGGGAGGSPRREGPREEGPREAGPREDGPRGEGPRADPGGSAVGRHDKAWLAGLEDAMARHAVAATASRAMLVARLNTALAAGAAAPFPAAHLALVCPIAERLDTAPALEVEDWLRAGLAATRARDAAAGGAALGAHRTDLAMSDAATLQPASLASTGEQKTLLVGLVLGHAALIAEARGTAPLLLLDEPAVHLDPARRAALFSALARLPAQTLITGTDPETFAPLRDTAELLRTGAGNLLPESGFPPFLPP